jgi:hypothetical protein
MVSGLAHILFMPVRKLQLSSSYKRQSTLFYTKSFNILPLKIRLAEWWGRHGYLGPSAASHRNAEADLYYKPHMLTQRFGNCICFHPHVKGWETPTLLVPLKRANLVQSLRLALVRAIFLPEDGNRSGFRKVVFFRIRDDRQSLGTQ